MRPVILFDRKRYAPGRVFWPGTIYTIGTTITAAEAQRAIEQGDAHEVQRAPVDPPETALAPEPDDAERAVIPESGPPPLRRRRKRGPHAAS